MVVDVRSPKEFHGELGHIDSAVNVPLDELKSRLHELPNDRPLALICHTDRRSRTAARLLQGQGYEQVAVVREGMTAWRAAAGSIPDVG